MTFYRRLLCILCAVLLLGSFCAVPVHAEDLTSEPDPEFSMGLIPPMEPDDSSDNSGGVITSLYGIGLCTIGMMFEVNDTEYWKEWENQLRLSFSRVYGLTDDGQCAELELTEFDASEVQIDTPGEYEVTAVLSLTDECKDNFILPDKLTTWKSPIKVSDPADYELWVSKADNEFFTVLTLQKPSEDAQLLWLESEEELTDEQLKNGAWKIFPELDSVPTLNLYLTDFTIYRPFLTKGTYNYFQIVSDSQSSTILMIQDNGEQYNYKNMGGNRDGSTSDEAPSDSVTQPAPSAPETVPAKPSGASGSGSTQKSGQSDTTNADDHLTSEITESTPTVSESTTDTTHAHTVPMESFSEDQDLLYGVRLRLMRQASGGTAVFSKHGIQLTLASDLLDQLAVSDSDSLTVSIQKPETDTIVISVMKNDTPVTSIPDTKVTIPWKVEHASSDFILSDADGEAVCTGTYDEVQELLTCYVDKTGTYTISECPVEASSFTSGQISVGASAKSALGNSMPASDTPALLNSTKESTQDNLILPLILLLALGSACSSVYILYRKRVSHS